jgi:glutamyl-tRNA synthetase
VTSAASETVRVRFAPSPTGYLHIGSARTVLFNWLLARKLGGKFILRIEDTDQTRHVEDSVQKILDDLRWLGLNWDEGPEVGGEYGPYFQSQRLDIYNRYLRQLLESGDAYYSLETPEQLTALREAAKAKKQSFKYLRPDPTPTVAEGEAARAAGRPVVVRFKMPPADITVVDDILGPVTLPADHAEDFVIQKGDGYPTYHFACVVDDELMKVTHVLRGQEHLLNTTKHAALQRALGFATPRYAHLSVIFNMDGSKMSKRDKEKALKEGRQPPEIDVHDFRLAGYLPEAVTNFIALLGWSPGDDREFFDLKELTAAFSIDRVGKANARFDREKLLSFNTTWAARLTPERLLEAFKDYIRVTDSPMRTASDELLRTILRVCAGFRTFRQVEEKVRFLFLTDDAIEYEPKAVQKVLAKNNGEGYAVLSELLPALHDLRDWSAASVEKFIQSICEQRAVALGQVAQPLRVAVTGTTISPSIHDTLSLLGRERTLLRVDRCLSQRALA